MKEVKGHVEMTSGSFWKGVSSFFCEIVGLLYLLGATTIRL